MTDKNKISRIQEAVNKIITFIIRIKVISRIIYYGKNKDHLDRYGQHLCR